MYKYPDDDPMIKYGRELGTPPYWIANFACSKREDNNNDETSKWDSVSMGRFLGLVDFP
jgi:hypothetical protein